MHSFLEEIENSQWISAVKTPHDENFIKEFEMEEGLSSEERRLQLYEEWNRRQLKEKMKEERLERKFKQHHEWSVRDYRKLLRLKRVCTDMKLPLTRKIAQIFLKARHYVDVARVYKSSLFEEYSLHEEQRAKFMKKRRERFGAHSDAYRKFIQKSENVVTPFNVLDLFQEDDLKREEILKRILERCFENENDLEDRSGSEEDSAKINHLNREDEAHFLKNHHLGEEIYFADEGCLSGEENPYQPGGIIHDEMDVVSGEETSGFLKNLSDQESGEDQT